MRSIRGHLTYSNVMATLAVFLVLGGGAYAASKIGPNDIAKNAVRSKHIKSGQVKRNDQAPDQRTEWAVVNANKTIAAQSGGISWVDTGGPQTGQTHLHFPDHLGTRPVLAMVDGESGATGQASATRCGTTPPGCAGICPPRCGWFCGVRPGCVPCPARGAPAGRPAPCCCWPCCCRP